MIPQLKGDYTLATPSDFTADADYASGDVVVVEARVGVVLDDVLDTETGVGIFGTDPNGVAMPKATGACTKHAKAYWDEDGDPVGGTAGSGAVTTTATDNLYIGRFAADAASGDATVAVELTNE